MRGVVSANFTRDAQAAPEADARRERVFPKMQQDPTGYPDAIGQGPFGPSDENARRLILGLA